MIAGKPTITTKDLTDANTEYNYSVPSGVNKILLRIRSGTSDLKLAYVTGDIAAGTYITIPAGVTKTIDEIKGGMTLYFQSPDASQTVEIEIWK